MVIFVRRDGSFWQPKSERKQQYLHTKQSPQQSFYAIKINGITQHNRRNNKAQRTPHTDAAVMAVGSSEMRQSQRFWKRQGGTGEQAECGHDQK